MNPQPNLTRREFLKKAAIGMGAAAVVCSGSAAMALRSPKIDLISSSLKGSDAMPGKILVAYASKCGSTAGVAEAVAKTLAERGLNVDLKPIDHVAEIDSYRAVVIGSAIRFGAVLPAAAAFIKDRADTLKKMPVAYFTVGSTLFQDTPETRAAAAACTAAQKALVPPVSSADFAGVFDPARVSFAERLLGKAMKMPTGDFRNWEAIHSWADSLPDLLAG